jgi:hypothetical protein
VYNIAAVERGLAQTPDRWVRRAILVRGVAVAYHRRLDRDTISVGLELRDGQRGLALPLVTGGPGRMEAALRALPLVGRWLVPTQALQPERETIYRVRLSRVVGSARMGDFQAVLLDDE